MAKRFEIAPIPKGEVARYVDNPYDMTASGGMFSSKKGGEIVRPNDDFLVQRGGSEAFNVYQKLLFDETVQASLAKLAQEITSREWKLDAASEKPGDIAIKEFCEEILNEMSMDDIYRGFLESYIVGFSVSEIMWRRTPGGVRPFDVRFRDQRRFKFQAEEDADQGFTMRLATQGRTVRR